jgi:hypothetical protein
MSAHAKLIMVAATAAMTCAMTSGAWAVSTEVAKRCSALAAKQFPPKMPGNPAAGVQNGTVLTQRDYFRKCLQNNGNMDNAEGGNQGDKK